MLRSSAVPMVLALSVVLVPPADAAGTAVGEVGNDIADGDPRMVAVIKAPRADVICQEIATRIVAELIADGVPVTVLSCPGRAAACAAAAGLRPSAVVLVRCFVEGPVVEVRTAERAESVGPSLQPPAPSLNRSVQGPHLVDASVTAGPAALSIRAVELLKVMLSEMPPAASVPASVPAVQEIAVQKPDVDPDPPRSVLGKRTPILTPVPIGPRNLTFSLGTWIVSGFVGLPVVVGPTVSVGRRSSEHVLLSVFFGGPAFGPEQLTGSGILRARHESVMFQADVLGLFWNVLVLRAGMGVGLYHIHVDSETLTPLGDSPTVRRSSGVFSGLISGTAGVGFNLRSDMGLFVDARAFALTPTPVILFNGIEVARAGRPSLAWSAGLELRF